MIPVAGFVVVAVSIFIAWYMLVKRKGNEPVDKLIISGIYTEAVSLNLWRQGTR